jgi:hypothetical protein
MKKLLGLSLLIAHMSHGFAQDGGLTASLSSKVIINETTGYYSLSDGTLWKVIGFSPRWRSLSEWWNNVNLMPDSYQCNPSDWFLGSNIQILPKINKSDVSELNASNKDAICRATHLLTNQASGKVLFAVALRPEECIVELYNESYKEGYNQGYHRGQLSRDFDASRQYEKGYESGYHEGYKDAFKDKKKDR